ncbi:MAG: hypothetical protein HDQ88_08540 [Clostridia bacterium]|nr:hypothetical protein [Clostridia bacterium]
MSSVVHEWMNDLTFKQQTVVLSALRGCDGFPKEDVSKKISRFLCGCILKNGGTKNTNFMKFDVNVNDVEMMRRDMDKYPMHYLLHLIHSAEIIGYYHPDEGIREFWNYFYLVMVDGMHLHPETKEENEYRLRDGVDSD